MSDNVIEFPGATRLDIDPARVLDGARHLRHVFVIGLDKDGELYFASSLGDSGTVLFMLEDAKQEVLDHIRAQARSRGGR